MLPPEASPPLGPLTAAVPSPLAVIPTGSVILALAPTPAAATSAPLPCFAEGTAPIVIPTPTPGFSATLALEAAAPLALPPSPVTALPFETLAATPTAVYPSRPTSATAPIVLRAPTRPVSGAPVPASWDTGRLPEAAPMTALAMTSAPVLPGVGTPVLAAAAVASLSHARPVTPDTQTPASASAPTSLAVTAARGGSWPLPDAASGHRVGATSARPPLRVVTAPSAAAAASRTEHAALLAEGRANPGSAASVSCMCSEKRGVKHLLVRIDEREAAGKKRRAETTMQLKYRSKRQTAASAHAADVKRILSEVLKAVNYVGTAIGHGASAAKELCRAVDERGAGPAEPAGAADRVDPATVASLSPAFLDVPRKVPWAKDMVVSRELCSCCWFQLTRDSKTSPLLEPRHLRRTDVIQFLLSLVFVLGALTYYPHDVLGHAQNAIRLETTKAFKDNTADAVPWPSTYTSREMAARHLHDKFNFPGGLPEARWTLSKTVLAPCAPRHNHGKHFKEETV